MKPRCKYCGQLSSTCDEDPCRGQLLETAADEMLAALNEWMQDTEADDQRLEAAITRYGALRRSTDGGEQA